MASRDEILRSILSSLVWVVTGSGPEPRSETDMRAINDWIERAVDAWLLREDTFEVSMLQAMRKHLFTVASVVDGELRFQLTDHGRAYVDSMPHDLKRISEDGIK